MNQKGHPPESVRSAPETAIVRTFQSLRSFLLLESAGGLILMMTATLALVIANSPLSHWYDALLDTPVEVRIGAFSIAKPLLLWINDGLMAVFFFLIGLELKREVLEGHISSMRQAAMPAFAAVGGMLVPALIYFIANRDDPLAMQGWAIPTATDIAFALGVLSLLGPRVPAALKAFLLSVAIFDDLGAIIVIALFYTVNVSLLSLAVAGAAVIALAILNRAGVLRTAPYVLLGILMWTAVLKSGVHATLAGVVLALFIPLRTPRDTQAESPLHRLEHTLHPWVAFGVLPVFAFANAGVQLNGVAVSDVLHPVPLGIIAGLTLGKQIGVMLFSWIAVRLRLASLPDQMSWAQLYGTSMLCGIGFTMSLFIAGLAFEQAGGDYLGIERLGILIGSLISGLGGYIVLRLALPRDPAPEQPEVR